MAKWMLSREFAIKILMSMIFCMVFVGANVAVAQVAKKPTPVEHAKPLPRPKGYLATIAYPPTEMEKSFFEKLSEKERVPGSWEEDYSITGKTGTYVGWFGIVREIKELESQAKTELLIEMKYFDGLTDEHIMAVSFNGAGDFKAILSGTDLGIEHLSLVKVYGFIKNEVKSVPEIEADYVRHWDWGTFTFIMAYGKQKGNTKWRKLNKVPLERIYSAFPDKKYYEDRLGQRQKEPSRPKEEQ